MPKPQAKIEKVLEWYEAALAADNGINAPAFRAFGFAALAVRGYFENTMGDPKRNDVGIFDDGLFLLNLKKKTLTSYSWNTDPSRLGFNPGVGKGFAILQPGIWLFHKGQHKNKGKAWRQPTPDYMDGDPWDGKEFYNDYRHDGSFKIWRGKIDQAEETGYFAINAHWALGSTSSWGCQTGPGTPDGGGEWGEFQQASYALAPRGLLPYILINNPQ